MADLQAKYTMNTTPAISHTVTAETKRSGKVVYYRLKIVTDPITGYSYFGYNLKCTATVAGNSASATIKDNYPSQWSSQIVTYLPSSTGWYTITGITSAETVSASIQFTSNSGNTLSSGSRTLSVPAGTSPSGVTLTLSASAGLKNTSVTLNAGVSSWGDSGAGHYEFGHSSDGKTWTVISTTSKTLSFTPPSYGYTDGSTIYFRVAAVNARNLKTTCSSVKYVCYAPPDAPTDFKISPQSGAKTETVTLSWSGSAESYEVRVRYSSDGSEWTAWQTFYKPTAQSITTVPDSYTSISVGDSGVLQYAVRAKNTYGQYSAWTDAAAYSIVSDDVANVYVKIGGTWHKAKAVYVKSGGTWHKVKKAYIKTDGTWKN